ncbi:unnamed protein product [Pylaiella littoralis]
MSIAAVATGASALDANWTLASLKCTKPALQGGPNVVDLAKVIRPDGATFSSLPLLEVTEAIAPIVESRGNLIRRVPVCSDGSCSDRGGLLPRHGGLQGGGGAALHAPVGTRSFARHAPRERSEGVSAGSPGASRHRAWLFRASGGDISREGTTKTHTPRGKQQL